MTARRCFRKSSRSSRGWLPPWRRARGWEFIDGRIGVTPAPDGVRYESTKTVPFGKPIELPAPVGITLDTEPLKTWVR